MPRRRDCASGDNPAAKNVIANMLPLRPEKARVVHQPALPFAKLPALMKALRATEGTAARLLELIILTGMRFNAVHAARFAEFDLDAGVWIIPASRMKALGRDHRVPIGSRAVAILRDLRAATNDDALFAGIGKNAPGKVLAKLLRAIGHDGHAVHGFRSAFKDWCHEERDHRTKSSSRRSGTYRRASRPPTGGATCSTAAAPDARLGGLLCRS